MSADKTPTCVCVRVSAVDGGHLTLPEKLFVTDADPDKRSTVPSMCFLIKHETMADDGDKASQTILLDLGVKRDLRAYMPAMHGHIANRQPIVTSPDTAESLRAAGIDPSTDVNMVMYTHVHWDHVGTPEDFPNSRFVVGSGTLHLLQHGAPPHYPAEIFQPDMLPIDRTVELPPVHSEDAYFAGSEKTEHQWLPKFGFPATIDFFGDGSLFIIDSPGHLRGHINVLARVESRRWLYLGGDCCHDMRILRGEKGIALYDDGHGGTRSVHMDTDAAGHTISTIQKVLRSEFRPDGKIATIEAVVAHDGEWREANRGKFIPGTM